jgi:hypothetical protein
MDDDDYDCENTYFYNSNSIYYKFISRILELERENEKLRQESALYLGNWVAAQELASWRQVLMFVKPEAKESDSAQKTNE